MKKLLLGCLAAWMLGACTPAKQQEAIDEMYLLVGSYCTPQKEGIKVYLWDNENGEATYVSGLSGLSNPSYQVVSANGNRVYSVGEDEGLTSTAHALTFDKESGKLALMNTLLTNGGAPCYINLSPDEQYVVTANYMGGSLTVFPLEESGRLAENSRTFTFEGTGPDKTR